MPLGSSNVSGNTITPNTIEEFQPVFDSRTPRIIHQNDAPISLEIVSQPPGIPLPLVAGYDFPEQAGDGITIYVLDTGANLRHPVSVLSL